MKVFKRIRWSNKSYLLEEKRPYNCTTLFKIDIIFNVRRAAQFTVLANCKRYVALISRFARKAKRLTSACQHGNILRSTPKQVSKHHMIYDL